MTFSNDTKLTEVPRLARHLVLAWVLAAPSIGVAALNVPQRPAASLPAKSSTLATEHNTAPKPYRGPRTYLAMVGPTALRFAEAAPTLPAEPTLPSPPKPKPTAVIENHVTTPADPGKVTQPSANDTDNTEPTTPAGNSPKPVSILPDDTRHEIRAEDVLPFFQFPSASDSGSAAIPMNVPATAPPPSSATYQQK